MTDNITLPREVVEQLLKMLEMVEPYADQFTDYSSTASEWPLNLLPKKVGVAITALRTALAAEQPKQEAEALADRLDDERMNLIERLADENERLREALEIVLAADDDPKDSLTYLRSNTREVIKAALRRE